MKTLRYLFVLILLNGLASASSGQNFSKHNKKHYELPDSIKKLFAPNPRVLKWKKEHLVKLQQNPDTVTQLNLDYLELTHWPDISMMKRLTELTSKGNNYHRVSGAISVSPYLKSITLTYDKIRHIRFQANDSIETLILSENELRHIPHSIKRLSHLKRLYINHNKIKRIPHWIKKLQDLRELEINYNRLKVNRNTFRRLRNLTLLQMGANHLSHIPDNIMLLKNLRNLNFGKNQLSSVPTSFGKLDSLRVLIFYKNKFTNIPSEIFHLHHLVELDFYYNSLDSIPQAIGNLKTLKRIYLSFNNLSSIPDTMRNLKNLSCLYIHHNKLKRIPTWITSLKKLRRLGIGYNQIKSLPPFYMMPSLRELNFEHNQITHFPWKILKMPNLEFLFTRHNPYNFGLADYDKLKSKAAQLEKKGIFVTY